MAGNMKFELVSPESLMASLPATAVQLPGSEGDMTIMPNHIPLITTLRTGIVRATSPEGDAEFLITGGFVEITSDSTSVLAERAVPVSEVTQEVLNDFISASEALHENATSEMLDDLAKQAVAIAAIASELGLNPNKN